MKKLKIYVLLFIFIIDVQKTFADEKQHFSAYSCNLPNSTKQHVVSKTKKIKSKKELEKKDKEPKRRAKPAPFDAIFPSPEYLGPTIGVPNTDPIYPLTKAFWKTYPCLKSNDIRVYGWINPSLNFSSSTDSNTPAGYNLVPNTPELQQLVLRIQRTPDTVQTTHVDYGFCLTNLFGIDYRYTTAQGIFSQQLLNHNNLYGYDPVEAYWQIYYPCIAQGMLVTVGRYLSPPDIESTLAPSNYLFTHSLMNAYDANTQTGINAAIKFDDQWTLLLGIFASDDMTPWAQGAYPTGQALVRWVSCSNNDSIWAGVTSFNGGKFKGHHDNLQEFNATWTHRFNKCFFTSTEIYYMYQYDGRLGGTCNFGPVRSFGGGGGCGKLIPGFSSEFGAVNFLEYKVSKKDFLSLRTDYLNDHDGERTGFKTQYMSYTFGLTHQFTDLIEMRPELRYEFAFRDKPYDNGTRKNQASINVDAIIRF